MQVAGRPAHPALAYRTTADFAEWYSRSGVKQLVHRGLCAGCHSISLGLLYFIYIYIYIFWYPVHGSGCEDSILIFVQSLI